jgi:hypothetical protein
MNLSLNKKKIYFIGGYLLLLIIIWYITGKNSIEEGFGKTIPQDNGIIKTFGTILVDKPEVAQKALLFRAVRPPKRRQMPSSYPGNDMNSSAWQKYLTLLSKISNQKSCGACWAFSSSGMLSDRFSLLSNGKIKVQLSPAKMVMCTIKFSELNNQDLKKWWDERDQSQGLFSTLTKELKSQIACAGNDLYSAVQELYTFGAASDECVPYNTLHTNDAVKYNLGSSSNPSNIPSCPDVIGVDLDTCADHKTAARIYRADDIYSLRQNEDDIMQEIFRWGPVAAGFKVYDGFTKDYDGTSIYMGPKKDSSGNVTEQVAGGHAIRIVGWGEEGGVKFWFIANSWSEKWGMKGYFRMKRGIPECQLESNVVGVKPEFPGKSVWTASLDIVEDVDRKLRDFSGHQLDVDSLYYKTAMDKIKEGKLEGDVEPIIKHDQLPNGGDYSNFWVADIIGAGKNSGFIQESKHTVRGNLLFVFLAVIGIVVILFSNIGN